MTALDQTKARNQLRRDPGRPMPCEFCGEMPEEHVRTGVMFECAASKIRFIGQQMQANVERMNARRDALR